MRWISAARPWHLAVASMAAILLWWALAVHFAYNGQWNALYCTGSSMKMPEWLESREPVYRVSGPVGYDGQWFHVLAHRPLWFRENAQYLDAPRLRAQRILLPLAAWLLAFGRFEWVDPAYYTLMLLSMGAGVWWTARLAELRGASPLWGLAFLLLPSSMSGIDRMLSDGPLVAAAAGFFYFTETGQWRAAWLTASLAPFIRESGLILPAAACAVFLWRRQWRLAAAWTCSPIAFFAWRYSIRDLPPDFDLTWKAPLASLIHLIVQPADYPFASWLRWALQGLDLAAHAGFLAAMTLALALLWRKRSDLASPRSIGWVTGAMFAGAAALLAGFEVRYAWDDFYSYGRVFAPIFFVLLLEGLERGRPALAAALLAPLAARMGLHFVPPAWKILRGMTGF